MKLVGVAKSREKIMKISLNNRESKWQKKTRQREVRIRNNIISVNRQKPRTNELSVDQKLSSLYPFEFVIFLYPSFPFVVFVYQSETDTFQNNFERGRAGKK